MKVSEMPIAKMLYARRLSDGKEFFVTSAFTIRGQGGKGGVNGVSGEERVSLHDGTYELFRK